MVSTFETADRFVAKRSIVIAFALMLAVSCFTALAPQEAYASSYIPFVSGSTSKAVRVASAVTAKEKTAYNRAYKACMDYANQPNPIVVDVSDLGLTEAQALHVGYLLHANGELFWMNTYNDSSFGNKQFSIPVYYDDATITSMRKQLDAAVAKAFKRLAPGMSAAMKVHVLHDYIIDRMDYESKNKTSYTGLVLGKGDCYGFARSMDLLLRRAGFTVDMAFRNDGLHAWNLVKVSGKWYHVDTTWDNGYTGDYYWKNSRCHLFLLQSDSVMKQDSHSGWWAHYKCTSTKYAKMRLYNYKNRFEKHCNDYKLYTKGFKSKGLKYKACGSKKVKLASVSSKALLKKKTISIPATVTHKGVKYKVVGIAPNALANAKAKVLKISSAKFSKARVKNSLAESSVSTIKLVGSAKKKKLAYTKYFAQSNSGKKVKVKK